MPKLLRAAVQARLRIPILNSQEAGLPESRRSILQQIWRFSFPPGLVLARADVHGLFILNETASLLWSMLLRDQPLPNLIQHFCREYGIEEAQAADDISTTLSFWDRQLLWPVPSDAELCGGFAPPPNHWHTAESYLINDRVVRIRVHDPQLAAEISPRLESVYSDHAGEPELEFQVWSRSGRIFLSTDGELISSEENPNAVRAILLQEMVRRTEPGREWLAVLHAGACGRDNSCVLLAGKSHSGKTTLSAALMASGFTFYCDDSAAVSRNDGQISRMPFRMMVREGSWSVLSSRFPALAASPVFERYGQRVRFLSPPSDQLPSSPGNPKALLFVSYSPGERTSMRPLLPFEALLQLRESGFWVQHDNESIRAFLEWLRLLPAFEFTYSDLDDAISKIRALFDR